MSKEKENVRKSLKIRADKDEQTSRTRQTSQTGQTDVKIDSQTDGQTDICTYLGAQVRHTDTDTHAEHLAKAKLICLQRQDLVGDRTSEDRKLLALRKKHSAGEVEGGRTEVVS